MQFNFKSAAFFLSLLFNAFFIFILAAGSFSKTSSFSFPAPSTESIAAAFIVSFPASASSSFKAAEISLAPGESALIQFSVFSDGSQANLLVNAVYDPQIVSVVQTGYGAEITALASGSTLLQAFTNNGVRDLAWIFVK